MGVVGRRINEAVIKIQSKDYENALIQISIAIDATAKKKYPSSKAGRRINKFLGEYESFIYLRASANKLIVNQGGQVLDNGKKLPQWIYEAVRCALLHGDELVDKVDIKNNFHMIGVENGKFILNLGHMYGLLLSVIVDPINEQEYCNSNPILTYKKQAIQLNELWGKIHKLQSLLNK